MEASPESPRLASSITFQGTTYRVFTLAEVGDGRDGMSLILFHEDMEPAAEVFYADPAGPMTFTAHEADLPLEAIEWLIAEAKKRLPPP